MSSFTMAAFILMAITATLGTEDGKGIPLFLRFHGQDGPPRYVVMPPDSTVQELVAQEAIPKSRKLTLAGRELQRGDALSDAGVCPESVIDVTRVLPDHVTEQIGNVDGGGQFDHRFDAPIDALHLVFCWSNGEHLAVRGYRLKGSSTMIPIQIGSHPLECSQDKVVEFDSDITECTVYSGGRTMCSVKALEFVTESGTKYTVGRTDHLEGRVARRPEEGYALAGFKGRDGWFIDALGCVFKAF